MGYEIDFLAVGESERSGDAIALRYGNLFGPRSEQTVITIDGGNLASGDDLVRHVKQFYQTNVVDAAILTHPDNDHASGMRQVVDTLDVRQLVMHLPWNHSTAVQKLMAESISTNAIRLRAQRNLCAAKELYDTALKKKISVVEPFAGQSNGAIKILGPDLPFYQNQLANFDFYNGSKTETPFSQFAGLVGRTAKAVGDWLQENWWTERLAEPANDAVTPENSSSVILLAEIEGRKILLTGDAGVEALARAADFAQSANLTLNGVVLAQAPHHGSRKNIGPGILNRLFGPLRQFDQPNWHVCVSAAKNPTRKHPHRKVTNAFRRRGATVHVTAGRSLRYSYNAPARPSWSAAEALPFYDLVQNDD